MFFFLLALLCLGILNIHLVLLVVAITMFIAHPVLLLFVAVFIIVTILVCKELL